VSVATVLSLVPMAPSAWRYYAEEIATGREDYYALAAERPGCFPGRGVAGTWRARLWLVRP